MTICRHTVTITDGTDHDVLIVGDGPAGLSAALLAVKNGLETTVFDMDGTWMHQAHLFNYPGIGSINGSAFVETLRDQVSGLGARQRQGVDVTDTEESGDAFVLEIEDSRFESEYPVIATDAEPGACRQSRLRFYR